MKTVLHVGCGKKGASPLPEMFPASEWREVRLDIDPGVEPDIVASIADMSVVESDSVDAIWCHHNLEHLHQHEAATALKEFFRVIRPGGMAVVAVPNLKKAAEEITKGNLETTPLYQSPAGPVYPIDLIYGHRGFTAKNSFMLHKTGFIAGSLEQKLREAGFGAAKANEIRNDILAIGKKV